MSVKGREGVHAFADLKSFESVRTSFGVHRTHLESTVNSHQTAAVFHGQIIIAFRQLSFRLAELLCTTVALLNTFEPISRTCALALASARALACNHRPTEYLHLHWPTQIRSQIIFEFMALVESSLSPISPSFTHMYRNEPPNFLLCFSLFWCCCCLLLFGCWFVCFCLLFYGKLEFHNLVQDDLCTMHTWRSTTVSFKIEGSAVYRKVCCPRFLHMLVGVIRELFFGSF